MFRLTLLLFLLVNNTVAFTQTIPLSPTTGISAASSSITTTTSPQRIISFAPFITEIAFSAGLGDKLIAVSSYSDYPEQAATLEQISTYEGINLERIISLEPDLILIWQGGMSNRDIQRLKELNFKLYPLQSNLDSATKIPSPHNTETELDNIKYSSLQNIAVNLEALSAFADDPQIGLQQAQYFRTQLKTLKARYNTNKKVRYFYQMADKPLMTFANGNWPSEVFEFCGGENIIDANGEKKSITPYPTVSIEQIIKLAPDVIFAPQQSIEHFWPRWEKVIPTVHKKQLWSLNPDWLTRPTMRTLLAIEEVCERFEQVR